MSEVVAAGLGETIQRDLARYNRLRRTRPIAIVVAFYTHPAFLGLLFYRLSRHFLLSRSRLMAKPFYWLTRALYPIVRIYSGVEVHPRCAIGAGAFLGHFGPIVVHPNAKIGDQVTIMQGATLGETRGGAPTVGARVSIGVSAVLLGPIHVGDYSVVAAGAVVTKNVPAGSVVGGVPARVIGERTEDQYDEVVCGEQ